MNKEYFIAKHGPLRPDEETAAFFRARCVLPVLLHGEWQAGQPGAPPILDGEFTSWGYFAAGQQPDKLPLHWGALDAALTRARAWTQELRAAGCTGAIGSEGDAPFFPFVQARPRIGRRWNTRSLVRPLPPRLRRAIDDGEYLSGYESEVQFLDYSDHRCLFMEDDYLNDFLEEAEVTDLAEEEASAPEAPVPPAVAAFLRVSDQMRQELKLIATGQLYPSFVEFPVLYVGENAHDQLVGVATSCVWT